MCRTADPNHGDHCGRCARKRNPLRLKDRHTHVDGNGRIRFKPWTDYPVHGRDTNFRLVGQPLLMNKTHEAARTIPALFDLAAVGIENTIAEIDIRTGCLLNQQELIATYAKMAIGEEPDLLRRERNHLADPIDHDKIVAEAVHLGKADFHGV